MTIYLYQWIFNYSSIFSRFSGFRLWGQQPKRGGPLLCPALGGVGGPKVFLGQSRDIVFPECPWSGGLLLERCALNTWSARYPIQLPEQPHLTLLKEKEQQLYPEFHLDDRASHSISKGEPRHPLEETHFSSLYPQCCSFNPYPKLVTIAEGRDENRPVNPGLRPFGSVPPSPRWNAAAHPLAGPYPSAVSGVPQAQ